MPQALIKINGTAGSNTAVPIATLVLLDNANTGGEVSYLWSILDQPAGATDALSATNIQNPTFTPNKEGTYLLKLVVNLSLASEATNMAVAGVRQIKTGQRVPAAGESTQASSTRGYAVALNPLLQLLDNVAADANVVVGVAGTSGLTRGTVLRATGTGVLKSGLPGQESVPTFSMAQASTAAQVQQPLFVLEGGVDGSTTPASGTPVRARRVGFFGPVAGAGAVSGNAVFVSDAGAVALSAGSTSRKIGVVTRAGGSDYDVFLDCGGFA